MLSSNSCKSIPIHIYVYTFVALIAFSLLFLPSDARAAYLHLTPNTGSIEQDETFDVELKINTEGESPTTTDAIIQYDESRIEYLETIQPAEADRFFPRFFLNSRGNKIFIGSAIQPQGDPQSGEGLLAIIRLKAKTPGTATLTIQCDAGKTTDSNITLKRNSRVTDIIECDRVGNAEFTIAGLGGDEPTPTPAATTPTSVPELSTTPTPILSVTPVLTASPSASPTMTLTPTLEPIPTELPASGLADKTGFAIGFGILLVLVSVGIKLFL